MKLKKSIEKAKQQRQEAMRKAAAEASVAELVRDYCDCP